MSKRKKAKSKKRKVKSKSKAIDLTLRLNVELEQGRPRGRVKRIRSRKRQNLRQMRNGMGGLTPANLKQPSFFGNTALLTNAAMAAMNNKAYATERQLLDMKAEVSAQQQGGRQITDSTQQTIQALQNELAVTRALGQAAHQHGQKQVADTQAQGRAQQAEDLMGLTRAEVTKRIASIVEVPVSQLKIPTLTARRRKELTDLIQSNNASELQQFVVQSSTGGTPVGEKTTPDEPPEFADVPSFGDESNVSNVASRVFYTNPASEISDDSDSDEQNEETILDRSDRVLGSLDEHYGPLDQSEVTVNPRLRGQRIGGKIQQHVRHAVEANEFSTPANRRATPRPHQVPASQAEETYDDTDSDDDDQLE